MPNGNESALSAAVVQPPEPDIASTAVRLGAYSWLAAQLFEITGGWVASTQPPAIKTFFGSITREWAWHAELWFERLPELREVQREDLVCSPSPKMTDALANLKRIPDPVGRLLALDLLCDRLGAVYASHGEAASPVREAATLRTLNLVRSDLQQWHKKIHELTTDAATSVTVSSGEAESISGFASLADKAFEALCAQGATLRVTSAPS